MESSGAVTKTQCSQNNNSNGKILLKKKKGKLPVWGFKTIVLQP